MKKKKEKYCYRCGRSKKELDKGEKCYCWGTYYKRHIWKQRYRINLNMDKNKFKPLKEMTLKELWDWREWAESEAIEYADLIEKIDKERRKRDKN